jgi:hypothetical protein
VTGDATNGYVVGVATNVVTVGPIGGPGGGNFGPFSCISGQLAVGTFGRSGLWLDGYGLACGVPSLVGTTLR